MDDFEKTVYQYQIPTIQLKSIASKRKAGKKSTREVNLNDSTDNDLVLVFRYDDPLTKIDVSSLPPSADRSLFFRRRAALMVPQPLLVNPSKKQKKTKVRNFYLLGSFSSFSTAKAQ
jgi:hypothetical protein